jgi:TolB-like protein
VAEVGAALSIATILEGSARVDGNRLRMSVELVDAANGFQVRSTSSAPYSLGSE